MAEQTNQRRKKVPIVGLQQLLAKKFNFLQNVPEKVARSLGKVPMGFVMIVWGESGNGKSSFLYDVLAPLMQHGSSLYLALEEGMEASTQLQAMRRLCVDDHGGKIQFTNHHMTYELLMEKLSKRHSPKIIVIDSIQYWKITYRQYQVLKETYPDKIFIFISHAKGPNPSGKVAVDIRYDAGIKVRVEGFVAFVVTRYALDGMGGKPYVIYEEGARKYWGKKYKKKIE